MEYLLVFRETIDRVDFSKSNHASSHSFHSMTNLPFLKLYIEHLFSSFSRTHSLFNTSNNNNRILFKCIHFICLFQFVSVPQSSPLMLYFQHNCISSNRKCSNQSSHDRNNHYVSVTLNLYWKLAIKILSAMSVCIFACILYDWLTLPFQVWVSALFHHFAFLPKKYVIFIGKFLLTFAGPTKCFIQRICHIMDSSHRDPSFLFLQVFFLSKIITQFLCYLYFALANKFSRIRLPIQNSVLQGDVASF